MYDIVIIGAGIIGTSIARELSRYEAKILVLEKDNDIANGTTMANSAVVHAGYDPVPGTKKAKLNVKGNQMYPQICKELDVPFRKVGSITLALTDEDVQTLDELEEQAHANAVPVRRLGREEILAREPNVSKEVREGLFAPTAGIVGPWELAIAYMENAVQNGVELALNSKVENIEKKDTGFKITTSQGSCEAKVVINCSGTHADELNSMIGGRAYAIKPRAGQYFVLDKSVDNLVNSVIFPCPSREGKGVLVVPTVHGNTLLGPTSVQIRDREGDETTKEGLDFVRKQVDRIVENIPFDQVIRSFAGVRASSDREDFIIEEAKDCPGFINIAGIDSPGLTAAPAIALEAEQMVKGILKDLPPNKNFNPNRKRVIHFEELSIEEKENLIRENPQYGNIICRCEKITEGEIVDAIHRPGGATTVKGIKKRVRPGTGRCQGGFCEPKVVEILARELGKRMEDILYDDPGSNILIGRTKEDVISN